MGDRTYCTLDISGALDARHIPALAEALGGADSDEGTADDIEQILGKGQRHFSFNEVNHAAMDSDVEDILRALGLGWVWAWEAGDEYPEGVTFFDPDMGEGTEDYSASGGEICLTLREIRTEGAVARAEAWDRLWRQGRLHVFESRHALLKIAHDHGLSEAQVRRALDAKIP